MGLLDIFRQAGDAKLDIMNKFMNPNGDGMYGKASQFLGRIEDRKNELFNPATSTLGALVLGKTTLESVALERCLRSRRCRLPTQPRCRTH